MRDREDAEMIEHNPKEDIILTPLGESLYDWRRVIKGPPESAYSEGHFELDIQIPEEYPINPPKVKFLSKVFHPNLHFKTGEICLDLPSGCEAEGRAVYTVYAINTHSCSWS